MVIIPTIKSTPLCQTVEKLAISIWNKLGQAYCSACRPHRFGRSPDDGAFQGLEPRAGIVRVLAATLSRP